MDNKDGAFAIIRNLQDAGLAVTLLSKHRYSSQHSSGQKDSIAGHNYLTTTGRTYVGSVGGRDNSPTSSNAQVTNDKCEGSFRVNRCNVEPLSPSYSSDVEIPMQRPEVTVSPLRARTSRHTELFANSLRKYPIAADTRSAELIQKLLDRTQAKHSRRRTEKRKSDGKRGELCKNNPSKSVQTAYNFKSETEVSDANVNKLEIRLNINRNLESRHSMLRMFNESSRFRRDDLSEMYDYLNASPTDRGRSSERDVLYLTNFIRDTIRQIVDDGSQECPNISSRFRNHQLSHHPEFNRCETTCPRSTNARSQETLPTTSRNEEPFSSESPWGICPYCTKPVHQCSCREVHLCNATNISKTDQPEPECHCRSQELKTKTSFEYYLRPVKKPKLCFCSKSKYERNVDLQLTAWLHELPIFVNECPQARKKREDIVKSLADKLKNNKINDDNIDTVKDEIQTAVKTLPIWYPEGKDESEAFRNKLSENLLCRLKEISKPTAEFEQLIINWLNRLPLKSVDSAGRPINKAGLRENIINELKEVITNRPENNNQYKGRIKDKIIQIHQELPLQSTLNLDNLEQLSNKLADELISLPATIFSEKRIIVDLEKEFQKLVSGWIFNIPEISSEISSNDILEIDSMVEKLSERLNTIPLQKGNEDYIQKIIRKEVKDLLNQLNVMKGNEMSSKNVDKYVNDIVNQLCDVTKSLGKSTNNIDEKYSQELVGLLQDFPELLNKKNEEKVKQLALKLKELHKNGIDEETCRKIMQEEIPKVLRGDDYKKIESYKRYMDYQKIKQNRSESPEPSNDSQTQNVESLILEWLDNIPELAGSVPDKDITGLSRTLQTLLSKSGDDENVKINLKDVTKNWLEKFSKKAGINLDPKINEKLASDLIYRKLPKQRKRWKDNDNGKIIQDMRQDLPQSDKNVSNYEKYSIDSEDKIRVSSRRQVTDHQTDKNSESNANVDRKNRSRLQEKYNEGFQRQGPDETTDLTGVIDGIDIVIDDKRNMSDNQGQIVSSRGIAHEGIDSGNTNDVSVYVRGKQDISLDSSEILQPKHRAIIGVNFENVSKDTSKVSHNDEEKIISSSRKLGPVQKTSSRKYPSYKGSDDRQKSSTEQERNEYSSQINGPDQKIIISRGVDSLNLNEGTSKVINHEENSTRSRKRSPDQKTAISGEKCDNLNVDKEDISTVQENKKYSPLRQRAEQKTIINKGDNSKNINEGTNILTDNEKKNKIISRRQVLDDKIILSREDSDNVNVDNRNMDIRKEQNKYSSRRQRPDQKRIIIRGVDTENLNNVKSNKTDSKNSPTSQVAGTKNSEFNTENLSPIKKDPQDVFRTRTKSVFQDDANKIVSNFLDEIMGKKFTKKEEEAVQELLPKLEEIMYDPLTNPIQKEDLMNKEIKNSLQKLSIAKSLHDNYAKSLMDRLKNVFKTSTPRGSMTSFHSDRELLPLFVDISNPSSDYNVSPASPEEVMYMNKLNDTIELWIDKLRLDFEDDRKFKRAFIKDLTSDIIDRQKYLQLNASSLSDAEELDHLKYQMFRWLNKKFSEDVVENVMSQIMYLRDTLKNISVPILIKPKNQHGMTSPMPSDSHAQKEISTFISGLPPNSLASNDQRYNEQIVKKLLNKLQLNNCDVNTEISDCLRKLFKSNIEYDIDNLTQQLKSILINEGFLKDEQLTQNILMDTSEFIEENLSGAIMDWLNDLSAYQRRNSSEKREMGDLVTNLAKSLKNILRQSESYSESILDEILIKEAMNHLKEFPLYQSQKSDDNIRILAKNLIDQLKGTQSISKRKTSGNSLQKDSESMAIGLNTFYKNIQQWCDEVPFKIGKSLAEIEDIKSIKRNITNRLLNKIGELNMNPDIFNDDMLYEDLLREEIDDMFLNLPVDESNLPALKEKLFTVVKEAKRKIQDELTARDYKERLRNTVSKYLPTPHFLSTDKEASFEILKENLTDAFVNLHFTTENENLKNKYRRRIHDELTKFCDSYLKRCPATPLDTVKLSQGLYNALIKIPVPSDEAIKNQIEQTRIKTEIIDWLESLPLRNLAGAEELQRSKFITLLAKYLHEAEMAKEKYVESDYIVTLHDYMKKEIVKFLKKYIRPDINNVEEFATRLMDSLKNTEYIRKFKPTSASQKYPSQKVICGGGCDPSTIVIQGSSLSDEDRDYLRRIRDRAACNKPFPCARSPNCRDAMTGSSPVNAGSQTEVCPSNKNCLSFTKVNSGRQPKKQLSSSTHTLNSGPPCRFSVRPQEIIPKVNINEYAWESTELSNSICPNETTEYCPQHSTIPSPLYNDTPIFSNRHPQLKTRKRLSFSCPNATFESPRKAQKSKFLQPNDGAKEMQSSVIGSDDDIRSRSQPTTPCPRARNPDQDSSKEFLISMNNDDYEPCSAYVPEGYGQTIDKDLGECKCKGYIMTKCGGMRPNSSCFQPCTSYGKSFRHHQTPKCRRGLCSHQNNLFLR